MPNNISNSFPIRIPQFTNFKLPLQPKNFYIYTHTHICKIIRTILKRVIDGNDRYRLQQIILASSFGFPSGEASGISSANCGGSSNGSSSIYVCLILFN